LTDGEPEFITDMRKTVDDDSKAMTQHL